MAELIDLEGENILDDYKGNEPEFANEEETHEETHEETPKGKAINIIVPEVKGAEFDAALLKIKEYKRLFPEECKNVDIKGERKLTFDELMNKIEECKVACANRPGNSAHRKVFTIALSTIELKVAPLLKMDLYGFSNTAASDDEIMRTLDEIALMRDWTTKYLSPEQRLIMGLGELAFRINAANKATAKEHKMPENKGNYEDL